MQMDDAANRDPLNDFVHACHIANCTNLTVIEARFDGVNFGYWYLEAATDNKGRRMLLWEARDRCFILRTRSNGGQWLDVCSIDEHLAGEMEQLVQLLMAGVVSEG